MKIDKLNINVFQLVYFFISDLSHSGNSSDSSSTSSIHQHGVCIAMESLLG
jgi:hypothetical protein